MIRWLILAIALIALSMAPRAKTSQFSISGDPAQDVHARAKAAGLVREE